MAIFCLVVLGVTVAIILRITGVAGDDEVSIPGYEDGQNAGDQATTTPAPSSRKLWVTY